MKSTMLIVISLMLFMLFGCNNAPDQTDKEKKLTRELPKQKAEAIGGEDSLDYLISESRVGRFNIGADLPQSSDTYQVSKAQRVRNTEEGPVEEPTYRISSDGKDMLVLTPQYDHHLEGYNDKIGEIMVLSSQYKTNEGLGVGSTVEAFQKAYPDFEMWYTYVSGRYIIEATELSVQFILNKEDFTGEMEVNSARVILEKDDFRGDAKIVKVRIFK